MCGEVKKVIVAIDAEKPRRRAVQVEVAAFAERLESSASWR